MLKKALVLFALFLFFLLPVHAENDIPWDFYNPDYVLYVICNPCIPLELSVWDSDCTVLVPRGTVIVNLESSDETQQIATLSDGSKVIFDPMGNQYHCIPYPPATAAEVYGQEDFVAGQQNKESIFVAYFQKCLKAFVAVDVNGIYGEDTAEAFRQYQIQVLQIENPSSVVELAAKKELFDRFYPFYDEMKQLVFLRTTSTPTKNNIE